MHLIFAFIRNEYSLKIILSIFSLLLICFEVSCICPVGKNHWNMSYNISISVFVTEFDWILLIFLLGLDFYTVTCFFTISLIVYMMALFSGLRKFSFPKEGLCCYGQFDHD